ncbi:Polysialic acid biosynthesis protein P7 [bioreactor metagenome]|uniref:Polysialic acid biosynthesis protein P7 n=1 Tax=bioreactor metagenome TaxID=1076179 RepID=A0A645I6A9_9ZZZZ
MEAPSFGIPTINIGDRQKGRLRADSIIDCNAEKDAIARAIEKALSAAFRSKARHTTNPYGAGNTAAQIKNTIKECLLNDRIHLKKSFYDIPFEVTQ